MALVDITSGSRAIREATRKGVGVYMFLYFPSNPWQQCMRLIRGRVRGGCPMQVQTEMPPAAGDAKGPLRKAE